MYSSGNISSNQGTSSYIQTMDNKLGSLFNNVSSGFSNIWNKTKSRLGYSSSPSYSSYGGKKLMKTKKSKNYKGGKGGLGLDYYATEVSGLKVAEPTYTMKYGLVCGGTKRKNKVRKTKKMRKYKGKKQHKGGKTF